MMATSRASGLVFTENADAKTHSARFVSSCKSETRLRIHHDPRCHIDAVLLEPRLVRLRRDQRAVRRAARSEFQLRDAADADRRAVRLQQIAARDPHVRRGAEQEL